MKEQTLVEQWDIRRIEMRLPGSIHTAALVLAGGQSRRMGAPKALIPWQGWPLIEHVLRRLRPVFHNVYIVAKDPEPYLHFGAPVIQDVGPQDSPLMGLYSGLVGSGAEWCFTVGCDMPFLSAEVIEHMATFLGDGDIVAVSIDGWVQPLHAFYSRRCIPIAARLLELGTTSLRHLISDCRVTVLPEGQIARLDPRLLSFKDIDTPQELESLYVEAVG